LSSSSLLTFIEVEPNDQSMQANATSTVPEACMVARVAAITYAPPNWDVKRTQPGQDQSNKGTVATMK
jgi:hypothetical protein